MKPFILAFAALVMASLAAWRIQPPAHPDGKTPLVWVTDDSPIRRQTIALFNELNPALNLELDPANGGIQKVIVQSRAGVGPDLFDCWTPQELASYVKAGIAWDVTDALTQAGLQADRDVWAAILPLVSYQGRLYGFPDNAASDVLWFNKALFAKTGLPLPDGPMTWEQFLPLARKLTRHDAQGRVLCYGFTFDINKIWKSFLYQQGGRVFAPDGLSAALDSPEAIRTVQFFHDLIYRYQVMPSPGAIEAMAQEGGWGSVSMKLLASGRVATALGGRWWLSTLRRQPGLRLGAAASPTGPSARSYGYGRSTLINRNSPRREEALRFLLYLAGEPYNHLVNQLADGLGPMKRFASPASLENPAYPAEDFHGIFPAVMESSQPEELSPYINAVVAERIIAKQLDLVCRNTKSPADAMRAATEQINHEIAKNRALLALAPETP